jgi:hypothetical protein
MSSAAKRRRQLIRRPRRFRPRAITTIIARTVPGGLGWALALAVLLGGCARVAAPARPVQAPIAGNAAVLRLARALVERSRTLNSLSTDAVMEYSVKGGQHVKARERIIARRPASLRVEAMSPFGVALVVATNGDKLQIFEPSKNTLMYGAANAATLARFARIPMAPHDAVALLMGIVPEARAGIEPDSVENAGGMLVFTYRGPGMSRRELGFQRGNLVMVRETGAGGALSYEVRYADYRDIGGVMFAYQVDADFPAAGTHLRLSYTRPIINGPVPDSDFVLTPGPGATLVRLGAAASRRAGNEG